MPRPTTPLRVAHRGMPRLAVENTIPSFELALDAGAEGIELDVHATRDGIIVVHHDPTLPGGLAIRDLDHVAFLTAAPYAPALRDVCATVRGRAELFVELKGAGIEQLVAEVLSHHDGAYAIHSFDHAAIARLRESGTVLRLGVLYDGDEDGLALMDRCGAMDLWPHFPLVTEDLVAGVHARRGRVIPWTVNAAADVARLTAIGVDGLCTDDVRMLQRS